MNYITSTTTQGLTESSLVLQIVQGLKDLVMKWHTMPNVDRKRRDYII
jgi:hypothetical protein